MAAGAKSQRRALVTGLTGQDGSFLVELLLQKGYRVSGMVRPTREQGLGAVEHLREQLELVRGDLLAPASLTEIVAQDQPDELYHLAAPSFPPDSWARPALTVEMITAATATLLEAVRDHSPETRMFVAVSSAIFGDAPESPQRETTPCRPHDPYATAKLAAHQLVGQFRDAFGLYVCSGILYNHESERRPQTFVTRKLTRAAAEIKLGLTEEVLLGDLNAIRDWSFAGDVVRGAWLMLQQDDPDDYVLASGVPHTVEEFAAAAFAHVGLNARDHVRVDPELVRPREPTPRVGDPTRARQRLGWRPTLGFEQLIARMVDADLQDLAG